jgi:ABC-2 type transport system ATP-binding protein
MKDNKPQPILEAENLVRMYGKFPAVNQVSFAINKGEIFSLLGPNGAGKTTTISMLSTLLKPTDGTARIAGVDILTNSAGARKAIGVVPQDIALYNDLTGLENLQFWGSMYNLGGKDLHIRAEEILDRIGLSDKKNQRVRTYSGGMKRRLNIGAGLLHRPSILFMDEPTVGIDPQSRRMILDLVKELNRDGMSVLYTTHYMEEAQELSHRVGIIDHGKMIAIGTQDELTALVGEDEILRLHTLDSQVIEQSCLDELAALSGVHSVSRIDGQIILNVANAETSIADAIAVANTHQVKITSVDIEEPNLEAVFLHLTGRALRD